LVDDQLEFVEIMSSIKIQTSERVKENEVTLMIILVLAIR
jgi:hypothetical protein